MNKACENCKHLSMTNKTLTMAEALKALARGEEIVSNLGNRKAKYGETK